MKILSIFILLILVQDSFSQLSIGDTTRTIPFDTNKIKEAVYLSNTSEVFSYDSLYIWSDNRSLSEVMDERPAYFINDFGLGNRNNINHGVSLSREIGIFRDGIQINDNFFQAFDIQNISINEIDKIEDISTISSFYYGINTGGKTINVITKDFFQPKPFSQLRYSQDREGSLFADVIFNQPVSRKLDVQLGVTKHSMDGRYENSAFDIWRGRARVNLYLSPKFNAKFNFYLDNFEREINDGLVYNPDKNILLDPADAQVVNPSAHEKLVNYYYDATLTGRFFKEKNSLTKLKIYSSNSIRDLTNILRDTSYSDFSLKSGSVHAIQYSADLSQNIFIRHGNNTSSEINAGANMYLNYFNTTYFGIYEPKYYSLRAKYDFRFKGLLISSMIRNDNLDNRNFLNYGIESVFKFPVSKDLSAGLNAGMNKIGYTLFNQIYGEFNSLNLHDNPKTNYSAGANLNYKGISLYSNIFLFSYERDVHDITSINGGINLDKSFISFRGDITSVNGKNFPQLYIKSDIAYKGSLFRNKLKLKTGFNLKFYHIKKVVEYSQTLYEWQYPEPEINFPQENQFIVDFYVGARIGRANINLTLANLFNSLVYNSYIFPLDDRGGFGNVVSRFTIVWDFIN